MYVCTRGLHENEVQRWNYHTSNLNQNYAFVFYLKKLCEMVYCQNQKVLLC
jgi:hypothetical protein